MYDGLNSSINIQLFDGLIKKQVHKYYIYKTVISSLMIKNESDLKAE